MTKYEEDSKLMHTLTECSIKCKHCGHTINLFNADRTICSWCGSFVYKNPKLEFRYKMKIKLREVENDRKEKRNNKMVA